MCRNIKLLFNFAPPTTDDEMRAAALQFVRKVSGMQKPAKKNEAAFHAAIEEIYRTTSTLLASLETDASPHTREEMILKGKLRFEKRVARLKEA